MLVSDFFKVYFSCVYHSFSFLILCFFLRTFGKSISGVLLKFLVNLKSIPKRISRFAFDDFHTG